MRRKFEEIKVGDRIGKWRITKLIGKIGGSREFLYKAKCDCGRNGTPSRGNLLSGKSNSCGCLNWGRRRERGRAGLPSLQKHRENGTYSSYMGMMYRCYKKTSAAYRYYGGRGISVCKRWHKFENFLEDMGDRPAGLTIERKNNDGNYEPSNCKWATRLEQSNNLRANRRLVLNGKTKTLSQWSKEIGIPSNTIHSRLRSGWSHKKAITEPLKKRPQIVLSLNGKTKTAGQWSRELGIDRSVIRGRLRIGWSDKRALTEPLNWSTK